MSPERIDEPHGGWFLDHSLLQGLAARATPGPGPETEDQDQAAGVDAPEVDATVEPEPEASGVEAADEADAPDTETGEHPTGTDGEVAPAAEGAETRPCRGCGSTERDSALSVCPACGEEV